jgi:hypothetical protein
MKEGDLKRSYPERKNIFLLREDWKGHKKTPPRNQKRLQYDVIKYV